MSFYVFWLITPVSRSIDGSFVLSLFDFYCFLLLLLCFLGDLRNYFHGAFPLVIYWNLGGVLVSVGKKCVCFYYLFWGGSATNTKSLKIKYSRWIFWNLTPTLKNWKVCKVWFSAHQFLREMFFLCCFSFMHTHTCTAPQF